MSKGGRASASRAAGLAALMLACGVGSAIAGDAAPNASARPGLLAGAATAVETVRFAEPGRAPVQLVRGPHRPPPAVHPTRRQVVSFGAGSGGAVTVIRGAAVIPASLVLPADPKGPPRSETVSFADPALPAVTVLRGPSLRNWFAVDLFGPPDGAVLDRVAFAVDGVESRHGADLRMWRPGFSGPQGPMQVSLAAALDVGGGNRFDMVENRLLGTAYLAQMFQRYGNWPDAVAAYNWGPGNMDQWILGGRRSDRLPFDVARYVDLVLRKVFIGNAIAGR